MKQYKVVYVWSENEFRTESGTFSFVKARSEKEAKETFLAEFSEGVSVKIQSIKEVGQGGQPGNQNNSKGGRDSQMQMRVSSRDKAGWVKAAQQDKLNLTDWATKVMNEAAKRT